MFEKIKSGFQAFVKSVKTKELNEKNVKESLEELKLALVKNDVAYSVAQKISDDVKEKILGTRIDRGSKIEAFLKDAITSTVREILQVSKPFNLLDKVKGKSEQDAPLVLVFLGVNGTGKTTTIAKVANYFKKNGVTCVIGAADTFRAGALEQLEKHANNVGVRVIKHEYKSDPSSVVFDTISHAQARHIKVVLIDTAGRQVIDKNLMREMSKIVNVADPDYVIYVGDAMAGNDVVSQVETFSQVVRVDASILTKVDADIGGGAALSVAYLTKRPIVFVGIGQGYDDLQPFDADWFLKKIIEF
ncbi:MAG: signal recognition particle-docking protein FtsY [Candidatus Lokiarchaeota archaeon]|nr:signal recognition particle-docking protein FtsY [Candidatus Lokiarchaeota archaeon]